MEINFMGTGNASELSLGNNNAYIKDNNNLLLIDFGYTSYQYYLKNKKKMSKYKTSAIITHLHADHVSGLPDLILDKYYNEGSIITVYVHEYIKEDLLALLNIMGINEDMYILKECKEDRYVNYTDRYGFRLFETEHTGVIKSMSLYIEDNFEDLGIIYTSDINKFTDTLISYINNPYTRYLYIDCASESIPVHLCLDDILNNEDLLKREDIGVYLMHLDKKIYNNINMDKIIKRDFIPVNKTVIFK